MRRRLVAAGLVALAACCGGAAHSSTPSGWRRTDLRPVTQPVLVAERILVYVAAGGGLRLVALDPASGATVWSRAASGSATAPGVAPMVAATGGLAIAFRGVGAPVAELVGIEARTGRVRWHGRAGAFTSWPVFCPGERAALCLTGIEAGRVPSGAELRFDARSGRLLSRVRLSSAPGARLLAPGLFDPATRHPEELLAANGRRVLWKEPLARVYPLSGASTDWGWYFDRIDRLGLYVGSPGWAPVGQTRTRLVEDLSRTMTAGFGIRDGGTVWRSPGTTYLCNYLPCAGSPLGGAATPGAASGPSTGTRLRMHGLETASFTGATLGVPARDATVTIEGFDPATGRTRWRFDAGHDPGLIAETLLPPQVGASSILVRGRRGRLFRLDLADGSRRAVPARTIGWCRSPLSYREAVPYRTGGGVSATTYYGQNGVFPCDPARRRVAMPAVVPSFVGEIGARAGRLAVWADAGGVTAAPVAR